MPLSLATLPRFRVVGENARVHEVGELDHLRVEGEAALNASSRIVTSIFPVALRVLSVSSPAAAAAALQFVRGIGHLLEFLEDEAGHDQRAAEEAGLADPGNAAVDDDVRIEQGGQVLERTWRKRT